ncbi:MAG: class I SAM-dependent methyltransferase, partial [Thiohalocapsa sp.]|nr:class I SAM-dependent methyltransferase [Thiohalocapsa sp.]
MPDPNLDYYERNAAAFFAETVAVDMGSLHRRFLSRLPERAAILDAGCGSGRDARAFAALGHQITAFDACPGLVALAEAHLGQTVHCLQLRDIAWERQFDGIWAC